MAKKTTLSYSGNEVTLADENGNTAIYILGSAGYATECTYKLSDQVRNRRAAKMHDTFARIIEILQIQIIRDRRSSPKNIGRVERLNRIYKWLLTPTI